MYNDPFLRQPASQNFNNFCPCGINATGDEVVPEESVNKKVINLQAWQYARMGLVLVGTFVIVKWIMGKISKSQ